ncbi:MAG: rane protein [Cryobacterium sp.]|nr:rane protein [Cryobacterium sp.]
MIIVATLVVSLAAALHVAIFIMESIGWTRPGVWKRFGVRSQADAETTRPLAYNQGFYNLFLAVGAIVGVVFFGIGWRDAGLALVVFTMASMLAAAVVLVSTGRGYLRAAFIQGTLPLLGLVLILLG